MGGKVQNIARDRTHVGLTECPTFGGKLILLSPNCYSDNLHFFSLPFIVMYR